MRSKEVPREQRPFIVTQTIDVGTHKPLTVESLRLEPTFLNPQEVFARASEKRQRLCADWVLGRELVFLSNSPAEHPEVAGQGILEKIYGIKELSSLPTARWLAYLSVFTEYFKPNFIDARKNLATRKNPEQQHAGQVLDVLFSNLTTEVFGSGGQARETTTSDTLADDASLAEAVVAIQVTQHPISAENLAQQLVQLQTLLTREANQTSRKPNEQLLERFMTYWVAWLQAEKSKQNSTFIENWHYTSHLGLSMKEADLGSLPGLLLLSAPEASLLTRDPKVENWIKQLDAGVWGCIALWINQPRREEETIGRRVKLFYDIICSVQALSLTNKNVLSNFFRKNRDLFDPKKSLNEIREVMQLRFLAELELFTQFDLENLVHILHQEPPEQLTPEHEILFSFLQNPGVRIAYLLDYISQPALNGGAGLSSIPVFGGWPVQVTTARKGIPEPAPEHMPMRTALYTESSVSALLNLEKRAGITLYPVDILASHYGVSRGDIGNLFGELIIKDHGTDTLENRMRTIAKVDKAVRTFSEGPLWNSVLLNYANAVSPHERMTQEVLRKQTPHLWRSILLDQWKFVAPQGNIFIPRHDSELAAIGVQNVLFRFDRSIGQNYRVDVLLQGFTEPIELIVNTNKTVTFANKHDQAGGRLLVQPEFTLWLTNFLLKRLYIITRSSKDELGLFEHQPPQPGAEAQGTPEPILYRSAHFRELPMDGPVRYTLKTASAKEHARLILRERNIDIWKVMRERWEAGTLHKRVLLTYVQETVSGGFNTSIPLVMLQDPATVTLAQSRQ